jgi:hypothetical protein
LAQAFLNVGKHIHTLLEREVDYPVDDLKATLWNYVAARVQDHVSDGLAEPITGSYLKKMYKACKKGNAAGHGKASAPARKKGKPA